MTDFDAANPYSPPRATPSAPGGLPPAPLGLRLAARLIDLLVFYVPVIAIISGVELRTKYAEQWGWLGLASAAAGGMLTLLVLAGQLWMLWTRAQSLGKRMLGLRIVRVDGSPAEPVNVVLVRTVMVGFVKGVASSIFCGIPVLSVLDLAFLVGEDRRALHDYAAGTVVIRDSR